MFGLSLGSEHRILKFLEFPELTGVSLVIHKEPLSVTPAFMQTHKQERPLDSLRMGLVTRRPVIKAGNFQPPPAHLPADGHFEAWRGAPCPDLACVLLPSGYSWAASLQ